MAAPEPTSSLFDQGYYNFAYKERNSGRLSGVAQAACRPLPCQSSTATLPTFGNVRALRQRRSLR
eukprot:3310508-Amphidinium_carterae.1